MAKIQSTPGRKQMWNLFLSAYRLVTVNIGFYELDSEKFLGECFHSGYDNFCVLFVGTSSTPCISDRKPQRDKREMCFLSLFVNSKITVRLGWV